MAKQNIDPVQLALLTAKKATPASNKVGAGSVSTPPTVKPSLNLNQGGLQAVSTAMNTANTINNTSKPVVTPKEMPKTGSDEIIWDEKVDNNTVKLFSGNKDEIIWDDKPTTTQNVAGGAVASVYNSGLAEPGKRVAKFLGENVTKPLVGLLPEGGLKTKLLSNIEGNIKGMQDPVGTLTPKADTESTAFKTTKLIGDVGQALVTPGIPGITKGAGFLKGAGQLALQGLGETAKYSAIAEKRLPNKEELAYGIGGNVLIGGAIAGVPKVLNKIKIADKADDAANKMLTNMNIITKGEQEKFAVQQGKTVGKRLNDKGIVSGGSKTIDQVAKGFMESKNKADEGLALIKGNYKNNYLSTMANEAADFAENTLSPEASKIRALAQKADNIGLTMQESNEIKRFYERNNKFTYGRDITAGEKTVRATNLDNYVRNRQMDIADQNGLSNLREINKDTQGFKYILDKLVKNEDGRLGNNAVGLTDWIVAGQVATSPSAIGLLVGKKIASSNWFRTGVVKILNRLSGHTNEADKILDIGRIMQIQNEKDLNKFLSLPLKKNVSTPSVPLNSIGGNQGAIKGTNIANTPKPTPKTPPITVEKGAIGMGTPKVNNMPVIPPKATVAPSVSAPKVDTFKRMTELDSNPLYRKKSFQETNLGRNAKGLETEFGTIEKVNVDNRYNPQSYTIDGIQYPSSQVNNFREKKAPEVVAQANKASKAIADLKTIESGKGNVMGSSLRSVLDELGIKDVNSIPEGTESDILQMVRARKPIVPKVNAIKPKVEANNVLGKLDKIDEAFAKFETPEFKIPYLKEQIPLMESKLAEMTKNADLPRSSKGRVTYGMVDKQSRILENMKKELADLTSKPIAPKKGMPKLGKEIMEQDIGKIPEGSVVTNTKGKPLIVYHGTSKGGFDDFKSGYFTEDKGIAKIYESSSASSIGKSSSFYNTPDSPAIYEVQLDIKKPFDTRDKKIRDLFYKEYQGKYSLSNADLSKRGLPDWTEGEYIRDWIEETNQPFDGIIVDEGGLGGYGEKVLDRGISYAPMDYKKQVKILNKNINNKKTLPPIPKKGK